jgi:hypothetical protein
MPAPVPPSPSAPVPSIRDTGGDGDIMGAIIGSVSGVLVLALLALMFCSLLKCVVRAKQGQRHVSQTELCADQDAASSSRQKWAGTPPDAAAIALAERNMSMGVAPDLPPPNNGRRSSAGAASLMVAPPAPPPGSTENDLQA